MRGYQHVADVYEPLAELYSGGAIRAMKLAAARRLEPGARLLCAGAGAGEEVRLALDSGARITVVDRSRSMLALARRAVDDHAGSVGVRWVHASILDFVAPEPFDVAWGHFFLNVFDHATGSRILSRMARLVSPDGELVVSDFAPGRGLATPGRSLYYRLPLAIFWLVTGNAWRAAPDVAEWATDCRLRLDGVEDFRVFGRGPAWLRQWRFRT